MSDSAGILESIETDLKSQIICSNINRVCILHLLRNSSNNEMQAERIAYMLGVSHRTVLYHLDMLQEYGLVEVRRFRKRGSKLMRSVWGLSDNSHVDKILSRIDKNFNRAELDRLLSKNTHTH